MYSRTKHMFQNKNYVLEQKLCSLGRVFEFYKSFKDKKLNR